MLCAPPPYISKVLNKFIERWKEFNYKVRRFIGSRIPPPPPQKKKKTRRNCGTSTSGLWSVQIPGGGGLLPCMAYTDVPLDRVWCFTSPPRPPLGADMLEMTTDVQGGNNKTSQGLINTMQSHSVVKRFEITMIFYWITFIYGLKSPPLQVINDSLGNCFTCKW